MFNPLGQGAKFDPNGDYVRKYIPELAHIPGVEVHEPWKVLGGLDHGYPEPIVDHAAERIEALDRLKALPKGAQQAETPKVRAAPKAKKSADTQEAKLIHDFE